MSEQSATLTLVLRAHDEAKAAIASVEGQLKLLREQMSQLSLESHASTGSLRNLEQGLANSGLAMRGAGTEATQVEERLRATGATALASEGQLAGMAVTTERAGQSLQGMGRRGKQSGEELEEAGAKTGRSRAEIKRLEAESKAAHQSLVKLGEGAQAAGTGMFGLESAAKMAGMGLSVGLGLGAAASVKMAADFQRTTTELVTGAGESEGAIDGVRQGLLRMAGEVGASATTLAKGLYQINSAGFHGAEGLNVLRAAEEGAKVGGADAETVAKAVTTALKAWQLPAREASAVTSELIQTVASGKMHLQDLSASLGTVATAAASAGISLPQLAGAMATLTNQGIDSDRAATALRFAITALQAPTSAATKEMQALGLSPIDVALNLGKRGLTGTIELLSNAILTHMGPSGVVYLETMHRAKAASASLATEIAKLPTPLRDVATRMVEGHASAQQWHAALAGASPEVRSQAQLVEQLGQKQAGAQAQLASMGGVEQTYTAALAKMTGGIRGMTAAQGLVGPHAAEFRQSVDSIAAAATKGKDHVQGWALVQEDFSTKLDKAKGAMGSLGITLGTQLLPPLTTALTFLSDHGPQVINVLEGLAAVIGGKLVISTARLVERMVELGITSRATGASMFAAFTMGMGPVGWVVAGVLGIAAAFVFLYTHVEGFRTVVNAVFGFVKEHAQAFMVLLLGIFTGGLGPLVLLVVTHLTQIRDFFASVWNWIKDHIAQILLVITGVMTGGLSVVLALVLTHLSQIRDFFARVWSWISDHVRAIVGGVVSTVAGGMASLVGHVAGGVAGVIGWFAGLPGRVMGAVSSLAGAIGRFAGGVMHSLWSGLEGGVHAVLGFFGSLWDRSRQAIGDWAGGLYHFAGDIIGRLAQGFRDNVGRVWDAIRGGLGHVIRAVPVVGGAVADALHLASGGLVRARAGGVPALLAEAGEDEWVIPASKAAGMEPLMRMMLSGALRGGGAGGGMPTPTATTAAGARLPLGLPTAPVITVLPPPPGVVEVHTTVELDGMAVGRSVSRELARQARMQMVHQGGGAG